MNGQLTRAVRRSASRDGRRARGGRHTGRLAHAPGHDTGGNDWATLRVPFRPAGWDGTTLTFDTALGNEGTTRWALVVTPAGDAMLRPTTEEGKVVEDAPTWEMSRR